MWTDAAAGLASSVQAVVEVEPPRRETVVAALPVGLDLERAERGRGAWCARRAACNTGVV